MQPNLYYWQYPRCQTVATGPGVEGTCFAMARLRASSIRVAHQQTPHASKPCSACGLHMSRYPPQPDYWRSHLTSSSITPAPVITASFEHRKISRSARGRVPDAVVGATDVLFHRQAIMARPGISIETVGNAASRLTAVS
jgi:hypothetical protein